MPKYVTYSQVKKTFGVNAETLKNWARGGSINYRTIQNRTRKTWLYDIESIENYIRRQEPDESKSQVYILYARVSSRKQEGDLQRQVEFLQTKFPEAQLIKDVGSGLNWKRPGFCRLVEKICREEVSRVVVTYRDRLCRFGVELLEQVCKEHNCKIITVGTEDEEDDEGEKTKRELEQDLLSIVNVFVARSNGRRSHALQTLRKKQKTETQRNEENKNLSNRTATH